MNNRKLVIFALLIILLVMLISIKKGTLFVLFEPVTGDISTQVSGQNFPKTLRDTTGIEFILEQPPQRILSATLASDHMLSDLVDAQRLVAVSSYVDNPSMSNIIGFYDKHIARTQGEIESMLVLQPDLVFAASYSNPETVRYLLRSDIAVVRLSEFNSFADIFNNLRLIAKVTDSQIQAEAVIDNLQKRLNAISRQVKDKPKIRVLYYNLDGYSTGANSLMDESIRLSGGINVASGILPSGENKISEEQAISLQPDVIIINQWQLGNKQVTSSQVDILLNKKAWLAVPAIQNKRVYGISGKWLRSVSQHRINGVEAIAKILHPEIRLYDEALND